MSSPISLFCDAGADLPLEELLGESIAVIGLKGSGKSNTAARIVEQLLTSGVPLVIADIAGEYWGLKEKFPLVVAGHSANTDIEITKPEQAGELAVWSIRERVSVILDVSDYRRDQRIEVLKAYFEALWREAGALRRPYQIILEEAHNWIPQSGSTPLTEIITTIATEGRKRGLGILMVGQRSARIDKNVITQAGIFVLHRVQHPADIRVYEDIIPKPKLWTRREAVKLAPGEAILVSRNEPALVKVLPRETYHAGYTPGMDEVKPPSLTSISEETLKTLQSLLGRRAEEDDEMTRLKRLVGEQDLLIAQLRETMQQQAAEIERLAKISVQMPEAMTVARVDVGQVVAAPVAAAVPVVAAAPVAAEEPYRSPLATQRGIAKQEKDFEGLLKLIRQSIPMHQGILKYLLQHPGDMFNRKDLARVLGYQEATIKNRPPLTFIRMNLIIRITLQSGSHAYRSSLDIDARMRHLFPDLVGKDFIQEIILACGGG